MILSSSPQPPSAQTPRAQPPMQADDTTRTDPQVASLKAIFPDFDDAVIHFVLESTNHDHDRALDVLLGMNDPSFVPPNPPATEEPQNEFQSAPSRDTQRLSQEALDEQFARRLALEEQEAASQAQAWWQPQTPEGHTLYQPYQPRRGGGGTGSLGNQPEGPPQTQGQAGGGGRDTMADFQEGFNRIAESGKKTFSSIVSKVRAKMQEFDQGQGRSWSQNPSQSQQQQEGSSSAYAAQQSDPGRGAYAYAQSYEPPARPPQRPSSQSWSARTSTSLSSSPPRSGVTRPATTTESAQSTGTQQASYYDPNTRGYALYGDDDDEEIQLDDRRTASAAVPVTATTATVAASTASTAAAATGQRSATPPAAIANNPASPLTPSSMSTPPSYRSFPSSPPVRSLSPTIAGAKGTTTTGTPGGVDFSKLGLLPKRPISLVRPQSPLQPGALGAGIGVGVAATAPRMAAAHSESTTDSSTDREEPEFVENPFEDQ